MPLDELPRKYSIYFFVFLHVFSLLILVYYVRMKLEESYLPPSDINLKIGLPRRYGIEKSNY